MEMLLNSTSDPWAAACSFLRDNLNLVEPGGAAAANGAHRDAPTSACALRPGAVPNALRLRRPLPNMANRAPKHGDGCDGGDGDG